jgi:hypothetical protein
MGIFTFVIMYGAFNSSIRNYWKANIELYYLVFFACILVHAFISGAAIHSDFEEKFIRAEVIFWKKLLEVGSWAAAKEKGVLRLEGKEYVVQDGDVMIFKI